MTSKKVLIEGDICKRRKIGDGSWNRTTKIVIIQAKVTKAP